MKLFPAKISWAADIAKYMTSERNSALLPGIGSLSSHVFERRTSAGSGLFALLSRDFEQLFGQKRLYKSKDT